MVDTELATDSQSPAWVGWADEVELWVQQSSAEGSGTVSLLTGSTWWQNRGTLVDGATQPAHVRPPQSRALAGRHVLWPFNCVGVLLSPSLSNYRMIFFLNLKIWIMLWWVVQELPRGVFTQQLLLEWRPTLLGTGGVVCCVALITTPSLVYSSLPRCLRMPSLSGTCSSRVLWLLRATMLALGAF